MDDLVKLYCNVDDFWKDFSAEWKERLLGSVTPSRGPQSRMSISEMMTIVILFTTLRSNMKQRLMTLGDKILLRKRSLIETINDQLKNISQIEHTRHRSPRNFLVNLLGGLVAYTHRKKKPSLNLGIENALFLAS